MNPLVQLEGIARRYASRPDFAQRLAARLGAAALPRATHAVDGVDLTIARGEVMGLVGESGCGKSTLGRIAAGIEQPSEGRVRYDGRDLAAMKPAEARKALLAAQMIFQNPFASLNPRMKVGEIIGEAPLHHGVVTRRELADYVAATMEKVGLDPAFANRYPHQFSGGQRQRVGIARALAVKPDFLVCDESVAALDVSIQAQIINLFMDLRDELGLTYLFISHDIGVMAHISDRISVMYLGRIVESADTETLFSAPNHPYTRILLRTAPKLSHRTQTYEPIEGEMPSPLAPPPGCHFHPRCPFAQPRCRTEAPALKPIGQNHLSACHLND